MYRHRSLLLYKCDTSTAGLATTYFLRQLVQYSPSGYVPSMSGD
jgi:hypothetical protein